MVKLPLSDVGRQLRCFPDGTRLNRLKEAGEQHIGRMKSYVALAFAINQLGPTCAAETKYRRRAKSFERR
jgi:hypothetical protein